MTSKFLVVYLTLLENIISAFMKAKGVSDKLAKGCFSLCQDD